MPRVCIDCRYIGPRPSGIAKVVQALVDFIPGAAPDLDFLLLKHPQAPARLSSAENVQEVVVSAAANSPATMWWLARTVDLSRVDLFHATFNIMPAGLAMPCVTTIHDIMWLTNPAWCNARFSGIAERLFYQHGIRRALNRSAALLTVSQASRNDIADHYPDAADRVRVTRPGVSPEYHQVEVSPQRLAALGLSAERRFVLAVGQYVPYKNHDGVVRIFAQVAASFPDVDLVLVQRISRRSHALRKLTRDLGIAERVHILPTTTHEDLLHLFSAAQALLHPSFCEGFGLPLAEAMACGCPVVTSDRSAMAEVVGDAGLLASPYDISAMASALRTLLADPAARDRYRQKGLQRVAPMRWQDFAHENLAVYREIL